jgi:hypothetical protein
MRRQLGEEDEGDEIGLSWSWGHTRIALAHGDCAHVGDPASCSTIAVDATMVPPPLDHPSGAVAPASPWGIRIGYDSEEIAFSKLRSAGFGSPWGCITMLEHARMHARTCSFEGGPLRGLQGATARSLDLGDGFSRIQELEYQFELGAVPNLLQQLTTEYGTAWAEACDGSPTWWTGPVEIRTLRTASFFTVYYTHGRLGQLYFKGSREDAAAVRAADKAVEKRGL